MQHTTHIMPRDASPILIRRIGATQSGAGGGAVVAAAHGDERTLSVRSSTCCLRCNCCECDWATAPPAREPVAYRSYDRHSRPTDRPAHRGSQHPTNRKFEIAPILYSPAEPAGRRSARRTEATFTILRPTDSLLPFYSILKNNNISSACCACEKGGGRGGKIGRNRRTGRAFRNFGRQRGGCC